MRLSKKMLFVIWIIPLILGLVVILNFWSAISALYPMGKTTYLVYNQLVIIGVAVSLGITVYWSILIYYIHLLQENEIIIQNNFVKLAGSGTSHLENARKLIGKVLDEIKTSEGKLKF